MPWTVVKKKVGSSRVHGDAAASGQQGFFVLKAVPLCVLDDLESRGRDEREGTVTCRVPAQQERKRIDTRSDC